MLLTSLRRIVDVVLHPLPASLAAAWLSLLLFDAFPGDSIFYHLPFSVRLFNIHGFPDFTDYLDGRYHGFPSLWRFFMGPGLILDRPRLFFIPNLVALGLLAYCCRRILQIPLTLAICSCLAYPVALYGFRASVQDFFVNAMVLIACLSLFQPSFRLCGVERKSHWISGWDLLCLTCSYFGGKC